MWYRISAAEKEIGAGLIEEVIQVAEGELRLTETMLEHKVYVSILPKLDIPCTDRNFSWDELVEKPAEGQWSYFERKT